MRVRKLIATAITDQGPDDLKSEDRERRRIDAEWTEMENRWPALWEQLSTVNLRICATSIALALGLVRADKLGRELRARRLPPFRLLRNWKFVVELAQLHEDGVPISRWAMSEGSYPHMYYRLVEETTGMKWGEVRRLGVSTMKVAALNSWAMISPPSRSAAGECDT